MHPGDFGQVGGHRGNLDRTIFIEKLIEHVLGVCLVSAHVSLLIPEVLFVDWLFAVDVVNATLLGKVPRCNLLRIGQVLFVESAIVVRVLFVLPCCFSISDSFGLEGISHVVWGRVTAPVWDRSLGCWGCLC